MSRSNSEEDTKNNENLYNNGKAQVKNIHKLVFIKKISGQLVLVNKTGY